MTTDSAINNLAEELFSLRATVDQQRKRIEALERDFGTLQTKVRPLEQ